MDIGAAIKRRREKADITRAQLAPRAGMPRQQLVRLESDASSPTLRTLERVAGALGCATWQLVQEAEHGQ